MWHPWRLFKISHGNALNYLQVSSAVIVLRGVYPVGMDESVSVEPQIQYSNRGASAASSLWRGLWLAPLRGIKVKGVAVLNIFFSVVLP